MVGDLLASLSLQLGKTTYEVDRYHRLRWFELCELVQDSHQWKEL